MLFFIPAAMVGLRGFIHLGLWLHLTEKRSLRPLRKDRLPDLVMTRLDQRNLWPGLLAAPLFVLLVLFTIDFLFAYGALVLGVLVGGLLDFASLNQTRSMQGLGPEFMQQFKILMRVWIWIAPLWTYLFGALWWTAATVFVNRRVVPRGGVFGAFLWLILFSVIIMLPGFVISSVVLITTTIISVKSSLGGASVVPAMGSMMLWNFIGNPLLMVLMSIWLMRSSYRRLRDPKTWNELRRHAES